MKQIEYYLKLPYKMEVVEDVEEGGYVASFPDLPGCITCAETIAEAVKMRKKLRGSGFLQHLKAASAFRNRTK